MITGQLLCNAAELHEVSLVVAEHLQDLSAQRQIQEISIEQVKAYELYFETKFKREINHSCTSKALQQSLTDSSIFPCSLLMFARLLRESAWVGHNRKAVLQHSSASVTWRKKAQHHGQVKSENNDAEESQIINKIFQSSFMEEIKLS